MLNVLVFGGSFEEGNKVFYWLLNIVCCNFSVWSVEKLFVNIFCKVVGGWMEWKNVLRVCVFLLIINFVSLVLFDFFFDVFNIVDIFEYIKIM